jgi:hypothetical protein
MEDAQAMDVWRQNSFLTALRSGDKTYFMKVVDTDTDTLIAYTLWTNPSRAAVSTDASKASLPSFPQGTNLSLCNEFFSDVAAKRELYIDQKRDYGKGMPFFSPHLIMPSKHI